LQAFAGCRSRKRRRVVARVILIAPPAEIAPDFERVCQFPVPARPDQVLIRIVVKLLRETAIEEVRLAPR
jgi:hypothetical protein